MRRMRPEDEWEELDSEERRTKIMMIVAGIFLTAAIIVLCVLIWKLHSENGSSDAGEEIQGGLQETVGTETEEPSEAGPEETDVQTEGSGTETPESADNAGAGTPGSADNAGADAPESAGTGTPGGDVPSVPSGSGGESAGSGAPSEGAGGNAAGAAPSGNGASSAGSGAGGTGEMTFTDTDETVTAKEITNLRSEPSTANADTVVMQLMNGQTARRTGINEETGWSRVEVDGQVLYAATSLLTTDLNAKPPQENPSQNTVVTAGGRTVVFTPCDDTIMPKIEVNLRSEPATDGGDSTVRYLVKNGETLHRTGYDIDRGWSRVEYNGEVLYVVTNYTYIVEDGT